MFNRTTIVVLLAAAAAPAALAQQHVSPANKYAWSENAGWLNFADAGSPTGSQSVLIATSFLSGYVWGENIGWINMGDGTPANGVAYANVNGTDFGVNLNTITGELTGYAWGENVGWINFSGGALATPAKPARIDFAAYRFRGYAWAENIGWINLDDATHYVGLLCPADINADGFVNALDYDQFASWFEAGDPQADYNGDSFVNGLDYDAFASNFEAGC
ncbi:MAG: hypothetical protein IT432_16685 [Phycisphaerales bacterium]|nr:hypothetical protein [Phycisphaerales bacterium]